MPVKSKFKLEGLAKALRYAVFATNIIAIILLLLSTLAWTVVPSKATIIAYLGMGFPFLLAANIIYFIFWILFRQWKLCVVQLIAILFCWNPISTYFPIHRQTDVPEGCIKFMTYNVRGFNWLTGKDARNNPMIDYIVEQDADIVCMQEFIVASGRNNKGLITEAEFNERMKNYPYRSIIRLGNMKSDQKYGIACYSKFPIEESKALPIESTFNGSALFKININGKIIALFNNHLESNRITAEDKKLYKNFFEKQDKEMLDAIAQNIQERLGAAYSIRENQANIIKTFIDKQEKIKGTIICGDFNDTPISYTYHTIKGNMIDSYAHTGFGPGITYHENKFWFRIDYIIHSTNLESYNCTVDKVKYSDHYPVWAYLRFR